MARPLRIEYSGAYYHVTSRGNEQRDIFRSQRDRHKFLDYLESSVVRYGAVIHGWCLMSNHYHLLIETPAANLSQIMRHINGAYTTYFNIKRKRAGHLFQGRYKAILVDADCYILELSRYIHLNPVRAGIVTTPEDYTWSSYRSYMGRDETPDWLNTDIILNYFGDSSSVNAKDKYRQFIEDALDKEYDNPLDATIASTVLGSEEFVQSITRKYLGDRRSERDVPAVKLLSARLSLDQIIDIVEGELGEDGNLTRKVSIFFCRKFSGLKLKKIGDHFGISDAAVSQAGRRLELMAKDDLPLQTILKNLEYKLGNVDC